MPPHIDPRRCIVALDAGVLERTEPARGQLAHRFRALTESGAIKILAVNKGRPVLSTNCGAGVRKVQTTVRNILLSLVQGKVRKYEYHLDESSLFEPLETVSRYLITDDPILLRDRDPEGAAILIVTLEEFFTIYQAWVDWNS